MYYHTLNLKEREEEDPKKFHQNFGGISVVFLQQNRPSWQKPLVYRGRKPGACLIKLYPSRPRCSKAFHTPSSFRGAVT